jgi:replicative DNA helicase
MELHVPPNDELLEKAITGIYTLQPRVFPDIARLLIAEDFYSPVYREIFQQYFSLWKQGKELTVWLAATSLMQASPVEKTDVPWPVRIVKAQDGVTSFEYEGACAKLRELHLKRKIRELGGQMYNDGQNPSVDVFKAITGASTAIQDLLEGIYSGKEIAFSTTVTDAVIGSLKARDNEGLNVVGLPTGSSRLDTHTGGWQAPDLIILAARPGCGKTTLALDLVTRVAEAGTPVGFVSVEMSVQQLVWKMLSKKARLQVMSIKKGYYSEAGAERLQAAGDSIGKLPIFLNDRISDISDLRSWGYKMVQKNGVRMICIDYLQLMGSYNAKSRENVIADISVQCKRMAKELDIPVILLSQLSREAEKKSKPKLSDLRESGAIEQDADQVIFIYDDPDVEFTDAMEDAGYPKPVYVEWAKFRLGTPGVLKANFYRKFSYFEFDESHK